MTFISKKNLDDTLVRNEVIKFAQQVLGLKLISNPAYNKIDLICKKISDMGVEVEHGKWSGDYWKNDSYSLISNLGFRTLNIPKRKHKYWSEFNNDKYNPSHDKNLFIRTNKDFTQFLIVEPQVVKDSKKLYECKFQPNNSDCVEDWLSFKKKDVITYNLIKGQFIQQT
jgi:hypothetical protein